MSALTLSCLVFFISACSSYAATPQPTHTDTAQTAAVPTRPAPTPALTPTPIPAVQTDCPPANTARAAVMSPLTTTTSHPNLVYLYGTNNGVQPGGNKEETTFLMRRLDTTNGQKSDILKLSVTGGNDIAIMDSRISPDKQWILFSTYMAHTIKLQLVRMDGQELQTIYCEPYRDFDFFNLSWSPDQKYILFSGPGQTLHNYDLYALNMTNGKVQDILQPSAPPVTYPVSVNVDVPMKWLNSSSLLIAHIGTGGMTPADYFSFAILNVTSASTTQEDTSLQQVTIPHIASAKDWGDNCGDMDSNADGTQLLYSTCLSTNTMGFYGTATIEMLPLQGGNARIIYTDKKHLIANTRFATPDTILFVTENEDFTDPQLWKIDTDGTNLTRVFDARDGFGWPGYPIQYKTDKYFPITSDGTIFAYYYRSHFNNDLIAAYGTTAGGNSVISAKGSDLSNGSSSSINLLGWTTI